MPPTDDIDKLLADAGLSDKTGSSPDAGSVATDAPTEPAAGAASDRENADNILSQLNMASKREGPTPSAEPAAASAAAIRPSEKPFAAVPAASFPEMAGSTMPSGAANDISLLESVNVKVQVLLGQTKLSVEEILKLAEGSVVELNKLAGEPLDILVNDKIVAQGEVLVLNENFCIRVTDIVPPEERG